MRHLRFATADDIPLLQRLIARSGRELSVGFYTVEQAESITRHVFGVDSQLIDDRTYFVIEEEGKIIACGGWSKRRTMFGGDQTRDGTDPLLDPESEPARIRAFFVEPQHARRGLGRELMSACVDAARREGFGALELVATLPGEPLYLASGFAVIGRFELDLPDGVRVPVSKMRRSLSG